MDIKKVQKAAVGLINKYKFAVLILLTGVILMLMPVNKKTDQPAKSAVDVKEKASSVCDELTKIIQHIDGVGNAKIMLTVATGEETLYQINEDVTQSNDSLTQRRETVIITDSSRNQSGLIRQINPPRYLGAIILCDGANSAAVKYAVIDAVSKITGLRSDCISVLAMK